MGEVVREVGVFAEGVEAVEEVLGVEGCEVGVCAVSYPRSLTSILSIYHKTGL